MSCIFITTNNKCHFVSNFFIIVATINIIHYQVLSNKIKSSILLIDDLLFIIACSVSTMISRL